MAEIHDIGIRNVEVRNVNIPSWMTNQPRLPSAPPVTVRVGVPIIDIPGCVEAHLDNKKGTNDKLVEDDPDGARVFCDGNVPFNPVEGCCPCPTAAPIATSTLPPFDNTSCATGELINDL